MKLVRWCLLVLMFCSSMVVAQVAPAKTSASPKSKTAAAFTDTKAHATAANQLPADAAVVTVPKLCAPAVDTEADCKTVVTRAEFEELMNALLANRPGSIPEGTRASFAMQYGEMLVIANEAKKRGLDKDHDTQLLLQFSQLQVLANSMLHSLQEQTRLTDDDIRKYYDEHLADYGGVAVQRVMIPTSHGAKKQGSEAPEALAEQIPKRFVAGEDAAKLQQEIFDKFGFKNLPSTSLVLRPSDLSQMEEPITRMKVGEISPALYDGMSYSIYKSEGPKPLPFAAVKQEIEGILIQQKVKAGFDALLTEKKPELNSQFFTPLELRQAQKKKNPHEE